MKGKGGSNTRQLEFDELMARSQDHYRQKSEQHTEAQGCGRSNAWDIHGTLRCMVLPEH